MEVLETSLYLLYLYPSSTFPPKLKSNKYLLKLEKKEEDNLKLVYCPICKSWDHSNDNHLLKSTCRENPRYKIPSDIKLTRRKLLNSFALGLIRACVSTSQPAIDEPGSPAESTSSRMSYSRFFQYLDEGAVRKVDLFENGKLGLKIDETEAAVESSLASASASAQDRHAEGRNVLSRARRGRDARSRKGGCASCRRNTKRKGIGEGNRGGKLRR